MRNIIFIALMTLMVWAMMIGCMSCQRKVAPATYGFSPSTIYGDWELHDSGSTVFDLTDSELKFGSRTTLTPGWETISPTTAIGRIEFNCIPEGQEYDTVINVKGELWKIRAFRVYFDSTENCYIEKE